MLLKEMENMGVQLRAKLQQSRLDISYRAWYVRNVSGKSE
jgi:hypothetical protein